MEYDDQYVKQLTESLRKYRTNNELYRVVHILRAHSDRNIANILNPELYRRCYIGTKTVIEEFQKEVYWTRAFHFNRQSLCCV